MYNINETIEDQILSAMQFDGLNPPVIVIDGKIHRFPTNGKPGDTSGWYIFFRDGVPAGSYGDWRRDFKKDWGANIGRTLTKDEKSEYGKRIEIINQEFALKRDKKNAKAKKKAEIIFKNAISCLGHPYLTAKGIQSHGVKCQMSNMPEFHEEFWLKNNDGAWEALTGNLLFIPLYNIDRVLCGLQAIDENGRKSLLSGTPKIGLFYPLFGGMKIAPEYDEELYIAEGFSTAATIRELMDVPTIMAIDVGNLKAVALVWHSRCPKARIIIAGDFDKSGTGQKAAFETALVVGGRVVLPTFSLGNKLSNGESPSDFNDLYLLEGREKAKDSLTSIQNMPNSLSTEHLDSKTTQGNTVKLTCASEVEPESIDWVWNGWLAAGKFHILAGAPGTGKTTIALSLAAIISRGSRWPDGSTCKQGNIIIWSGEDDVVDTLTPRLIAQGADRNHIYFVDNIEGKRSFDPSKDIQELSEMVSKIGDVKFVIVDPVVNAVSGDSHKNAEVRRDLQPLVKLAKQLNAAVLGISHFSKGTAGREPLDRVTGSLAFGALPRIVMATAKINNEQGRGTHLFVRAKSNIGLDEGGFGYSIQQIELSKHKNIATSQVIWGSPIAGAARELLTEASDEGSSHKGQVLEEAKDFIKATLTKGPIASKEIFREAKELGISCVTLRRAKKDLGVLAIKENFDGGIWFWKLPFEGDQET